jgi:uncharacterized protein (DUF305 family)
MALRFWLISGLLPLSVTIALGQPIVQPGAPGESSKSLSPGTASSTSLGLADPDVKFMQGMIMHHSQAVEMTALMPARTHNKDLLAFGKRISISQSDEMKYMKQWLEDRGKPVEMEHDMGHMNMAGMDHSKMDHSKMDHSKMDHSKMAAPMMMPGMLTPEQMKALAAATGPTFDRLFLTGMIQHHGGALTMVDDLFKTPGAGQDAQLYDFATDVDNTQRAEINIMQGMLPSMSKGKK